MILGEVKYRLKTIALVPGGDPGLYSSASELLRTIIFRKDSCGPNPEDILNQEKETGETSIVLSKVG